MRSSDADKVVGMMLVVARHLWPEWDNYDFESMEVVENTKGIGFRGTKYEGWKTQINAYRFWLGLDYFGYNK